MKLTLSEIVKAVTGQLYPSNTQEKEILRVSTDSRKIERDDLFVPLVGEQFDGHDYIGGIVESGAAASLWLQSKPIPKNIEIPLILVEDTLQALQELAHYYRNKLNPIIVGITGSNGKTTTKDLIASVLSTFFQVHKTNGNYNNHIGVPLTLLAMPENTEVAVVEMGMSNLGEIETLTKIAKPDLAVITNIGESHIEFLGTRENIAKAKLEIVEGLSENGVLILNGDESLLRMKVQEKAVPYRVRWVGSDGKNDQYPIEMVQTENGVDFKDSEGHTYSLPLFGEHNVMNALMAIEVGNQLKVPVSKIAKGLSVPELTSMRLEKNIAKNGSIILNDAYNASPTSMQASLRLLMTFTQYKNRIAILGDMFELGKDSDYYHQEIGKLCATLQLDFLITTGQQGRIIYESALYNGMDEERVIYFENKEEIASYVLAHSNNESIILIKASRGMQLEQVVRQLLS